MLPSRSFLLSFCFIFSAVLINCYKFLLMIQMSLLDLIFLFYLSLLFPSSVSLVNGLVLYLLSSSTPLTRTGIPALFQHRHQLPWIRMRIPLELLLQVRQGLQFCLSACINILLFLTVSFLFSFLLPHVIMLLFLFSQEGQDQHHLHPPHSLFLPLSCLPQLPQLPQTRLTCIQQKHHPTPID